MEEFNDGKCTPFQEIAIRFFRELGTWIFKLPFCSLNIVVCYDISGFCYLNLTGLLFLLWANSIFEKFFFRAVFVKNHFNKGAKICRFIYLCIFPLDEGSLILLFLFEWKLIYFNSILTLGRRLIHFYLFFHATANLS